MNSTTGPKRPEDSGRNDSAGFPSSESSLPISKEPFYVGEFVAGKYRVERVIGEGAMGVVLAATHIELDEIVAVKFIRPELQEVPGVVGRFAREAKALVRIKSEHSAKVLDVGIAPGRGPFIVMEYLEGKDLATVLAENGPLPIRRAVEYVLQACEALAVAHANGITHRDIKPENLFLTRSGDLDIVKVLDFGISKAALVGRVLGGDISMVRTSYLMGTPLYMSPEQIRATSDVDPRTDIWSLGVVLYELLSGKHAFLAESVTQICAMVLESQSPTLVGTSTAFPAIQQVIERCLDKNPANRFQNVAELAVALVPFAPSRARGYGDKCVSILRGAGIPVNVEIRHSSLPAPSDGAMAVSLGRIPTQNLPNSTTTGVGIPVITEVKPPAKRSKLPLLLSGIVLGCVLGLWITRAARKLDVNTGGQAAVRVAAPGPESSAVLAPEKASEKSGVMIQQGASVANDQAQTARDDAQGHAGSTATGSPARGRIIRYYPPLPPRAPAASPSASRANATPEQPKPGESDSKKRVRIVDDQPRVQILE